jgi:hypothetical protein
VKSRHDVRISLALSELHPNSSMPTKARCLRE